MFVPPAARFIPSREISIDGNVLYRSEYIQLNEGVLLDRKLTFDEHAKHTRVKALKCIRIVIKRKSKLCSRNKLLVHKSSFRPAILLCGTRMGWTC